MPLPISHLRTLVLDDDEVMRSLLEALLSPEGFEVTLAESGDDALLLLHSSVPFDLILSDVQMPGLEGAALAEALRAAAPPATLLLGMSASAPAEGVRKAFDGFLLKPLEVQLLRQSIEEAKRGKDAVLPSMTASALLETSAPSASVPPLDDEIFSSLQKTLGSKKLGELFEMAVKDVEKRHERIATAAAAGDLAAAQREAHAIKGACGMIGAAELQALAASIEEGKSLDQTAIAEIPPACLRLRHMLESKLQIHKAPSESARP